MLISPAFAQAATGAQSGGAAGIFLQLAPLIAIFVIFYFLLIRPQQKRMKTHRAMIEAVKRGDTVVTSGGIIGKVTKVEDAEIEVEIASGVKVRVVKGTLSDVRAKGEPIVANDAEKA
jgi:preprotein translocase subunit YajC